MDGWINLDKPAGLSSAGAVSRVKRLLPRGMRIGHAGTLDPFATGVLVLLVGRATRLCEQFMSQPKQYDAVLKLGATTATLDPKSPELPTADATPPLRAAIQGLIPRFVGQIEQRPPAFSAVHVGGMRAYKLAREGQAAELAARPVVVHAIEILGYDWPFLCLRIDCGKGTYIRSLARDIGNALEVGAYVSELRRTRVGPALIESAVTLDVLQREGVAKFLHAT